MSGVMWPFSSLKNEVHDEDMAEDLLICLNAFRGSLLFCPQPLIGEQGVSNLAM